MIRDAHPVLQAFLGTLFTWGVTALGAAMVIFLRGSQRKFLDASLGFASGVMLAASFWSLLIPAIDQAKSSGIYGDEGQYAFGPVIIGFLLGALFCYGTDVLMSRFGTDPKESMLALAHINTSKSESDNNENSNPQIVTNCDKTNGILVSLSNGDLTKMEAEQKLKKRIQWKRVLLLVIAVTVHNIPEGLAVGIGFGSIGSTESATFENAVNLALGIGIQNFPEGLVVSLPLHAAGYSLWKSIFWGQMSGTVEPIFAVFGALAVTFFSAILPYALSFAAAAMIYVVADDLMPESNSSGNGLFSTWGLIAGFCVMMFFETGGDVLILSIFG